MHNNSNNNQNTKTTSTTQATNGTTGAGIDDEGGGEEPANPADKSQTKPTVNNIVNGSSNAVPNSSLLIPTSQSPSVTLKSPKSPRPQISVEITPATPKSGITASSTFNSVPPSAVSQAKSSPAHPHAASKRPVNRGPASPHEAVQSWVQSQATSPTTSTNPNAHGPPTPGPSAHNAPPTTTKRNSLSSDPRARRPSVSSQKSLGPDGKEVLRPPSVAGSVSGGEERGKFSLRDLLSGGTKMTRRNSASSKKSVSSGGGGPAPKSKNGSRAGSQSGESALESKYGIYGKMAVGKGATSVVRLAHKWDRTEEKLYAVKEFRPRRNKESERDYVKKLTSEFCIASALRQPNIVETVDLMQDNDAKWCVVMEFCPGGDLYNAIRKGGMSPAEVECCFKQILTGVGYLHAQGVSHRDLKPENIFFDAKGQIKIGDFGASTVFRLPWEQTIHKSSGLCGSEPYIAPEQFAQPVSYDARLVDVWACGIIYYCLHFSELPWSCAQPSDKTYAQYAQQCASAALSIAGTPFLKTVAKSALSGATTPITPAPGTPNRQDSGATPTLGNLGMTPATPSGAGPGLLSPFGPSSGPATPSVLGSPIGSLTPSISAYPSAPIQSRAEREKEHQREQATAYPSTIHHLSPRAGRPVLRRMLEPKPEYRVTIEEVLQHPWVQSIEVCTLPGVVPKHIHPAAIAAAAAGGIVGDKYDK